MALPTAKTPKKTDVRDLTIFLYGDPKIGKSTFASRSEGAIFLATEPGLNHLEVFQVPCRTWEDIQAALADLAKGGHDFKTVVLDTIDNAYTMCSDFVCAKNKWEHPSDGDYGKGFAAVNGEFQRVLTKAASLPFGLMLLSHAVEREEETRTGKKLKTQPTLPGKARTIALGLADMILYASLEESRRVIFTKQTDRYEAGDRTGQLPPVLPLAYSEFVKAFAATKKENK